MTSPAITSRTAYGIALLLSIAALLGGPPAAIAQPVVRDMLDRAEIEHSESGVALHVYFRFPVHYVRHFPYESGDTLLIQVTPQVFEPRGGDVPRLREALRPPDDPDIPLTDIIFDNRTLWNPYVMLHFSRRVDFRVRPGADFRSVIVEFPAAVPSPQPAANQTPAGPASARMP